MCNFAEEGNADGAAACAGVIMDDGELDIAAVRQTSSGAEDQVRACAGDADIATWSEFGVFTG